MTDGGPYAQVSSAGLGARLRELRMSTQPAVSQAGAAAHVGVSQAKLSRAERGQFLLDGVVVAQLVALYGADADTCDLLVGWAEALAPARLDSRLIFQRGNNHFQERVRRIEEGSSQVRSFQPGMIIGAVQTEAYARGVMAQSGNDSAAEAVRARLRRGRLMLEQLDRQWILVHTEGALRWRLSSAEVMVEQILHLIDCSRRPNVRIGVITADTVVDFTVAHGFHLYDQQAVMIGTKSATALTSDERDVDMYGELFGRVERVATWGDAARAALARLADDYAG